ncbi:uncharacterized protein LOC135351765 isoform X2 [Halichondria panicea]|uniref:uncharacterized protein LOC135351765 isoform X2 n=1 Tax=Halichondria panicea TaxID=6063 RepID=UPI00312B49B7
MHAFSHFGPVRQKLARSLSCSPLLCTAQKNRLVLGCGSNVIDHIYNVKVVPASGGKGFFLSPFRALESKLIGGVTLNHLAWATLGGVPTGLLALQGADELGSFLRSHLKDLGVRTDFIQVDEKFATSQCHVFIQEDGERSILMAPATTSCIDEQAVIKYFDGYIQENASMVTTEISQVPLSGVKALLDSAKKANVLSVLDLDIPPSVAENEAKLGSIAEVIECVRTADVLKPAKAAAEELLTIMTGDSQRIKAMSHREKAAELVRLCDSKLVAITNGHEPSILATPDKVVDVAPSHIAKVLDTTGAGDAYLGGLITILAKNGLPNTEEELRNLGEVANGFGASCVQSIGGVPVSTSRETLKKILPDIDLLPVNSTAPEIPPHRHTPSTSLHTTLSQFEESLRNDALAANSLAGGLDMSSVEEVIDTLDKCEGQLLVSGVGKSGHVGRRFASSLGSIGLASHFIHATDFVHGDLGIVKGGRDVVMFLSHSGNTEECVRAAYHLGARGVCTIIITGGRDSKLAKLCTFSLFYNKDCLWEPFGCLPSTSLVIQEMLCNALLCQIIAKKNVNKDVYKHNHPGGSIGRLLSQSINTCT